MTAPTPSERLLAHLKAGTLLRHEWRGKDVQGREMLCALAALSPEVAESKNERACPADIAPQWIAYLIPWMDDAGTEAAWPGHMHRLASLQPRWAAWTPEQSAAVERDIRVLCIEHALANAGAVGRAYARRPDVEAACRAVIAALRSGDAGELASARAEAEAATRAAEAEAEAEAWAEASAAAAAAAARSAEASAAAAWAAARAAAWAAAARSAAWAAREEAADRLITAILDRIEAEGAE